MSDELSAARREELLGALVSSADPEAEIARLEAVVRSHRIAIANTEAELAELREAAT